MVHCFGETKTKIRKFQRILHPLPCNPLKIVKIFGNGILMWLYNTCIATFFGLDNQIIEKGLVLLRNYLAIGMSVTIDDRNHDDGIENSTTYYDNTFDYPKWKKSN